MNLDLTTTIIYLAGNLFRMYVIGLAFQTVFEIQASGKIKTIRALCYAAYYIVNTGGFLFFQLPPIATILTNLMGLTAVAATYQGKWRHRIYAIIFILVMYSVCENTIYFLMVKMAVQKMFAIGIITANLLFFMIILLTGKASDLRKGVSIATSEWVSVILIPLCSLFISTAVFDQCGNDIAVTIGGVCMILINVLVFYMLDRIQRIYQMQLDMRMLEQQNRAYEYQMDLSRASEERLSGLHHDMKNHFIALGQLAQQNRCEALQAYLHDLDSSMTQHGKYVSTGNDMIDGFLNIKLKEAADCGADIKTDVSIPVGFTMDRKDISIILGNLLDNALQALQKLKDSDREKKLDVVMKEQQGQLLMQISNSYNGEIRKTAKGYATTKAEKENHGLGLNNVSRIVEQYNGAMRIEHDEEHFIVTLVLTLDH